MDTEAHKEAAQEVTQMVKDGFLTQRQADVLYKANQENPDKARWFIATIAHHNNDSDRQLSDHGFARLCLMGIHRYEAQQGLRSNAPENAQVQITFNQIACQDRQAPNAGLLMAIRNYLTRTPADAGAEFARNLLSKTRTLTNRWSEIQDHREVFRMRASAESLYLEKALQNPQEQQRLHEIKRSIHSGNSLNQFL